MKNLKVSASFFLLATVVLGILSIDLSFSNNKYFDTEEDIKFRKDYNSNYTELITGGKVVFDYSDVAGTYCRAKKNLTEGEFVFKIPSEFLICGCKN